MSVDIDVKPLIIAAIPAYNEEKTIAKVILLAQKYVDKVIVCDDGSTDMTGRIAEKMGATVITHERNRGYGASLRSLIRKARELGADIMVTLDADGQHDPDEIPGVIAPITGGEADIVVGSRLLRKQRGVPAYRRVGLKALDALTNLTSKQKVSDSQSGFRAYNKRAIKLLEPSEDRMGAASEVLMAAQSNGLRIKEKLITAKYEGSRRSPVAHGMSVVMSIVRLVVEESPLLFLGVPGVVSLLFGVLFGVWMLQLYAIERRIVTNIALASIAFILIGLFAVFTAITLYAIARLMQKTTK